MSCPECCLCPECGAAAYCLSEVAPHPCPHDGPWCEDHRIEECIDCRLEAERDMYQSGDYDPRADPFVDHLAPPPRDRIAEDGGYSWDGGWVPVPPKEAS